MRVVLAAIAVVLVLTSAAAASPTTKKPVLRFVAYSPVTVRGSGWDARVRVRVTLRRESVRTVRYVRTGSTGAFALAFAGVNVDRCAGSEPLVTAVGAGESAVAKALPAPQCAPQP